MNTELPDQNNKEQEDKNHNKKKKRRRIIFLIITLIIIFNVFGFFSIQPIGMLPEGKTLIIIRAGSQLKFFDSADSMCQRLSNGVNILCRMAALGTISEDTIIVARLPYIHSFYLFSTGGITYEK